MAVVVKTVVGSHFAYFSGDWDVHWGYDLDFDPWPCGESLPKIMSQEAW